MKTTLGLLALFFIALGGGYLLYGYQRSTAPLTLTNSSSVVPTEPGTYSSAQVAAHNTSTSCWSSINGNVYDLTAWVTKHPGGEAAILSICGKDGTQAFEAQHGRSRDTQPEQILATYKIGTLST